MGGRIQAVGQGPGQRAGQTQEAELGHGRLAPDAHEEPRPPSRRLWNPGPGGAGMGPGLPPGTARGPGTCWTAGHGPSLASPDSSITTRILAGCTTGAMAVTCAQPTDVVKVRFQASIHAGPRSNRKYSGTMDAYRTIAREEGVRGLWKGRSGLQAGGLRQRFPFPRADRAMGSPQQVYSCDSKPTP